MIEKNTRLRIFVVWFFIFLWNDKIILSQMGKINDHYTSDVRFAKVVKIVIDYFLSAFVQWMFFTCSDIKN
jgi:hypothetical protein